MNQTSSQSENSHVEEYLNYYCDLPHSPGFAVLLKGQWGAGKTWFIRRYCEKLKDKKQQSLYVSLYGMTNIYEIEDAFFQQLHPILASKQMQIAGKMLRGILKGTLKLDLYGDDRDDGGWNIQTPDINPPEYLKDIGKRIIIFDDLERCRIDVSIILGYINYFVEHQSLKVIIIANEEKLEDEGESYLDIREKLIGKTFDLFPDFEGALENFITSTDKEEVRKFLSDNTNTIKELYRTAKCDNLRTLKQIVLDFERIFKSLPEHVKAEPEALKDILKFLMAFSIEIKRAKMLPKEISKLLDEYSAWMVKQYRSSRTSNSTEQESNEEATSLQKILSTYPDLSLHDPFPSTVWWQIFFDKGIVDLEELQQSILNSNYFQAENPDWVKLYHYRYLSDEEFNGLLEKVDLEYSSRNYVELGEIKHIFGLFLKFSDAGLYRKGKEEILEDSKTYIDYLKDSNSIAVASPAIHEDFDSYRNLGFQGIDLRGFKEFSSYIDIVRKLVKEEKMPAAAENLLEVMQSDGWKFHRMICLTNSPSENNLEPKYYETPILKYLEPVKFVEKLLLMNYNDRRCIFWALEERYRIDSINVSLIEELNWLKSVQNLLLEEIKVRKGKVSGFILESDLDHYFNGIVKKLEKTQKQIES